MSPGADVLGASGYERLRRAAQTHREDLVVRLGAEVGLRPAEMTRVKVADVTTAGNHHFLAVRDGETVAREAYLPADVEHDLRKFASAAGRDEDEPLLSVSARRLQMLVGEVADRAGEPVSDISSRDLRWRFAAGLLDDGVPLHVVCALGGWDRLDRLAPLLADPDRETVVRAVDGAESDTAPARLRQTIGVAADIGATLSQAATGEEIARTLCDRLAATDCFRFAWMAEYTGDGLTPRAMAGVGEGRVTEQRRAYAGVATDAIDGNEVRSVQGTDGPVVFVPLVREDAMSGVLAVGSTASVGDAEREVLGTLGTHVGATLSAVERKRLLLADTVTELTFQCTDADAVPVGVSASLGCRVELSGVVPVGGGSLLYYLVVDGAPTDAVLSYVADDPATVDARLIEDYRDGALLEAVVTAAPTFPLVESGGRIRDLTAEDGEATITAELPTDIDLREVVDTVVGAYPGTTVTAKHETERPVETDTGFRKHLSDRLSDRQATVLQAAYHSGYFEWPRGTTAEELADSLAVSAPTLHNHLRKAQGKLLTAFFAEESEKPSRETNREV